jgi:hypothetical protein
VSRPIVAILANGESLFRAGSRFIAFMPEPLAFWAVKASQLR